MEKDAAGYPSLPLHYGLMNPGISRYLASRLPTSRPVLRGLGSSNASLLPDYGKAKKGFNRGHRESYEPRSDEMCRRVRKDLYNAVGETLDHVTLQDILGWFNHSGLYATHA